MAIDQLTSTVRCKDDDSTCTTPRSVYHSLYPASNSKSLRKDKHSNSKLRRFDRCLYQQPTGRFRQSLQEMVCRMYGSFRCQVRRVRVSIVLEKATVFLSRFPVSCLDFCVVCMQLRGSCCCDEPSLYKDNKAARKVITRRRFDQLKSTALCEDDDSACTNPLSRFCLLRSADKSELCCTDCRLFETSRREPATGFITCVQESVWCHVSDTSQVGRLGIQWYGSRRLAQ